MQVRSGQVRSECLTCTFRASCCSDGKMQIKMVDLELSKTEFSDLSINQLISLTTLRSNMCCAFQALRRARCSPVVRAFACGAMGRRIDPSWGYLSYFSFQPVLHDWCNKGRGMCYPVCGMMHIKKTLLLIGEGSGFPLSVSEWSFTICQTSYNRK